MATLSPDDCSGDRVRSRVGGLRPLFAEPNSHGARAAFARLVRRAFEARIEMYRRALAETRLQQRW